MKFYTLKQIFNLIILLCSRRRVGVASGRGHTHQHAARWVEGGGLRLSTYLPHPAAQVAAGRDNKARACPGEEAGKIFLLSPVAWRPSPPLPLHCWACACPANCQKSFFKRAARLGFFFMRFSAFPACVFFSFHSLCRNVFQPLLHVLCRQLRCGLQFPP